MGGWERKGELELCCGNGQVPEVHPSSQLQGKSMSEAVRSLRWCGDGKV